MQKILIFSDLHIRDEGKKILGIDTFDRFAEGLSHAQRRFPDAAHLVLSGDLTNSGKISEYQRLKGILDQLELPYTLMCGNHDNRDNLRHVFPDAPVTDQGHLQHYVDIDDTRMIMIDTLDGPPFRNDFHKGFLCSDRLNWIDNALSSAPGRVLLFMHHPAWIVGLDGMDEIRMYNDTEAMNVFKKYNNVAHLFTGHLHRNISGNVQGLSFTTFKSPGVQTPLFTENLHISQSTPEPAAYGVVFLAENVIVHTEDFQLALDVVENCLDALPEEKAA